MDMALIILVFIATFFFMEFVAWAAHKYVMHGFLWSLHKDHHVKEPGFFEKNDAFFLIFAIPSWLCIMLGMIYGADLVVSAGFGILAYGFAYFLVHEVFIHQRFKWFRNTDNIYFRAVRRAHKMHHKHLTKEDGESFGMLIFPIRYLRDERRKTSGKLSKSA
ncbi:MAG: sterol desaturase family protein [Flavobacteriia bacterium]|nr:sterol desaturase family protein [Flavobacteriia bacterium]